MTRTQSPSEDCHANPKESPRSLLDNSVDNIRRTWADLRPKGADNFHPSSPLDSGMKMGFASLMITPEP